MQNLKVKILLSALVYSCYLLVFFYHKHIVKIRVKAQIYAGCRTVSNNGSGSGLAPAQNILAVQVWFGFT